jgi:hypothetical protein
VKMYVLGTGNSIFEPWPTDLWTTPDRGESYYYQYLLPFSNSFTDTSSSSTLSK